MNFALTELEERLAAPGGATLRDTLVLRLAATELRLRRQMAASLPRDDFTQASALADAAQVAQEVLATWPRIGVAESAAPALQFPSPLPRSTPWS